MPSEVLTPMLVFVAAVLTVAGGLVGAVVAARSSPYGELAKRVVTLEDRVEALERERDGLRAEKAILIRERDEIKRQLQTERAENRAYIRALIEAARAGAKLPTPPWWYEPTD